MHHPWPRNAGLWSPQATQTVDRSFVPYRRERALAYPGRTGRRLWRELRERGYEGGYTAVTDVLRDIRPAPLPAFEVRFETPPGDQVQVDFAQFQLQFTDEPMITRIVWLFSFVLGFSRLIWARFVLHQDMQTVCGGIDTAREPTRQDGASHGQALDHQDPCWLRLLVPAFARPQPRSRPCPARLHQPQRGNPLPRSTENGQESPRHCPWRGGREGRPQRLLRKPRRHHQCSRQGRTGRAIARAHSLPLPHLTPDRG